MLGVHRGDFCLAWMKCKGTLMTKAHVGGKELPVSGQSVSGTEHML